MRAHLLPLGALLLGAFLLAAAGGMQGLLLPLRAELEGFAAPIIGGMGAAYAIGFTLGCVVVPRLLGRVGHIRTFAVMASLAAATMLMLMLRVEPIAWVLLRAVQGFCFAGTGMVVESWINDRATNQTRGSIFAVYMVVNLAALTAGQMSLTVGSADGIGLFVLASILLSLSLLPTALSTGPTPAMVSAARLQLRALLRTSPLGAVGCFAIGFVNGAFATLGAVYLRRLGFDVDSIAILMSAALLGGVILQIPLGRLSDRVDRRYVLIGTALAAAGLAFVLDVLRADSFAATALLLLGLGGCLHAMYPIAVAHANDRAPAGEFVATAGGLLMLFGLGSIVGPLVGAAAMEWLRPGALLNVMTTVHLALAAYALWRIFRNDAVPEEDRANFAPYAKVVTQTTTAFDPRAGGPEPDPANSEERVDRPAREAVVA